MAFELGTRPLVLPETRQAIAAFSTVTTGSLGHLTDFGFADGLQPLHRPAKAVGLAYTVRVPHLDGVAVHYALSQVERGEILVIDTSGQHNRAVWGGITAYAAAACGVAAVILDGPITDWDEVVGSGPPVWCTGRSSSITSRKLGLGGAVQVPVSVGGAVAHPGDIVFADSDGVFFVRPDDALALAETLKVREAREPVTKARLDAGERLADVSGAAAIVHDMLTLSSNGS